MLEGVSHNGTRVKPSLFPCYFVLVLIPLIFCLAERTQGWMHRSKGLVSSGVKYIATACQENKYFKKLVGKEIEEETPFFIVVEPANAEEDSKAADEDDVSPKVDVCC